MSIRIFMKCRLTILALLVVFLSPHTIDASSLTVTKFGESSGKSEEWPTIFWTTDNNAEQQQVKDHYEEFLLAATATGFQKDLSSSSSSSSTGHNSHGFNETVTSTGSDESASSAINLSVFVNVMMTVCIFMMSALH